MRGAFLVGVVTLSAVAGLGTPDATAQPFDPDTLGEAAGCRYGDYGIAFPHAYSVFPEWAPTHLVNEPQSFYGTVTYVHLSHSDIPWNHYFHDLSIFATPDPGSEGLVGYANRFNPEAPPYEVGQLGIEWEWGLVPEFVWPVPGNRIFVLGQHVYDCGHRPYTTEIHPPRALVSFRDLPARFPETGDSFVPAVQADVWVSGEGGGATNRCKVTASSACFARFNCCPDSEVTQDVNDRDVEFDITPPRLPFVPLGGARMIWRELPTPDLPAGPPLPRPNAPPGGPIDYRAWTLPRLQAEATEISGPTRLHVKIPFRGARTRAYAGRFLVGWDKPLKTPVRRFRVTIDSVKVNFSLDRDQGAFEEHGHFQDDAGEYRIFGHVNNHWFRFPIERAQARTAPYPIGRSFDVSLYHGQPLVVYSGGYERDCMDDQYGKIFLNSPEDVSLDAITSFCHTQRDDEPENIGEVENGFHGGDLGTLQCPRDYGIGAHRVSSGGRVPNSFTGRGGDTAAVAGAYELLYHVAELPRPSPDPVLFAPESTTPGTAPGLSTTVSGARFRAGEDVQLTFAQDVRRTELGSTAVRCGEAFQLSRRLPPTPGGDYTVEARGSSGTSAQAETRVFSRLDSTDSSHFEGWAFGASEPVTVQHLRLAERAPGTTPPRGERVDLSHPVPRNDRLRLPSGHPGIDWVVSASASVTSDVDGSFRATLSSEALPSGYVEPQEAFLGLLHLTGGRSSYYYAVGERSRFWAIWGSNQSSSAARELDARLTEKPNDLHGSIDPVALLRDFDRTRLVSEEAYGTPAPVTEVLEYLAARGRDSVGSFLGKTQLGQLQDDVAELDRARRASDVARAIRATRAFESHLPAGQDPQVAALRSWARVTRFRLEPPLPAATNKLLERHLQSAAKALRLGDRAAAKRAIDAYMVVVNGVGSAAHKEFLQSVGTRLSEAIQP